MGTALTGLDAAARRDEIRRRLERDGFASVSELAEILGVSDMTVRRDLRRLERDGLLHVVHGGARRHNGGDFRSRGRAQAGPKRRIGETAAGLLDPDEVVLFDAGTTALEVAQALPSPFHGYVITHSVPVLRGLVDRPDVRVNCLGGDLNPASQALVGPTTMENLHKVSARTAVLGAAAVDERGLYVAQDIERSAKLGFIERADRVVLVADHTKLDRSAALLLAPLDVVDVVVTDRPVPAPVAQALRAAGVEVVLAEESRTA